jgi:hypothetical protein
VRARRITWVVAGGIALGALVGIVVASSGGDGGGDSADKQITTPELTVPGGGAGVGERNRARRGATGATGPATTTPPAQATPPATGGAPSTPPSGGSGAPATGGAPSGGSGLPPPGSPASRFEHECNRQPDACN